ncbi:MAG: NADH-quinone oxidoreductase subunit D [Candidatus Methanomethylicota archaeon]|uniref:NADH-quinone oxidoreductase subunit D n=1 Tax=Thermoproteota archaeon TaxID=2056631 RepID=A0A497F1R0_9CREN|nr:MAG: NADH-quinone oxidoreductase subunit D [Candidatus Verstraetearchaeota archaeon]
MSSSTGQSQRKYTVLPFGPQHPVLPEPIQLRFTCDEEKVIDVGVNIGYVHRGIERACELNDYRRNVYLCERVCGICNFMHALCYCRAVEEILDLKVPDRARYLRVIWAELNRLESHLLWLGLFADAMGFESLFMQFWRERELVMDMQEKTGGNRVIISTCVVGGVRRDIKGTLADEMEQSMIKLREKVKKLEPVILKDPSFKARAVGKGYLSKDLAIKLGAVGPTARGSGVEKDVRMTGYEAYGELGFDPVVEKDGDCYARALVRSYEVLQSIDLILKALKVLKSMPDGPIKVKPERWPEGEAIARVEQPRGELFYYVKGNGTPYLERVKIRTPTLANIPPLLAMLPGCEIADIPVIVMSIDPCIACTERIEYVRRG